MYTNVNIILKELLNLSYKKKYLQYKNQLQIKNRKKKIIMNIVMKNLKKIFFINEI
jgi:hypothetical protein